MLFPNGTIRNGRTFAWQPETVKQLHPWLEAAFEEMQSEMKEQFAGIEKRIAAMEKQRDDKAPLKVELVGSSAPDGCQGAKHWEEAWTRSLLLVPGGGMEFDPAIRKVVARFRAARGEARAIAQKSHWSEEDREDQIAAWTDVAEEERMNLERLGVQFENLEPGSTLIRKEHKVVGKRKTTDAELVGRIAECVHPRHTWRSSAGESHEPAEVIIYCRTEKEDDRIKKHKADESYGPELVELDT